MDGCSAASTFLTDSLELELGTEWCKPPCFSCAFDNREGKFSGESYLASGALKRLILNLDPLPTNFEEDTVELFGFQWVTETALVYSCRELFHLFRQQIFNLESLVQVSCDFGKIATLHAKADSIRQQCVVFLHYIKVFIFRCLKVQEAESHSRPAHPYEALEAQLPSMLVDELRGLLLYIGHLAALPSVTVGAFVNQNQMKLFPPSWHLFTLSEVKSVFSKAQIEQLPSPDDPKQALIQFLEAVGVTYRTLQTFSDKSAMVTKSLEYLGEVLKYIKPYLGKKVSSAGLQLTYGIMGILVKSWAHIFATSKAQKLLFRIIDCLLLPHTVLQQDKELPGPMLTAIQKTLPLYLQGICIVCCQSQNPNAYLNQLLRNVIEQYIGRFLPTSPCVSDLGQHPVLLALRNPASVPSMTPLRKHTVHAIRKSYLEFKGSSPPPRLASVLAFVLQLFKDTEMGACDLELLLPGILKCLVLVNEPQVKKLATENLQCMVQTCQVGSEGGPATQLTSLFRQFIQDYGMQYSYQVYSILETVATLNQHVVIQLIPTLTQSLKDSELKWGLGRNIAQREAYSRLLSGLGQVGQGEKQRLEK